MHSNLKIVISSLLIIMLAACSSAEPESKPVSTIETSISETATDKPEPTTPATAVPTETVSPQPSPTSEPTATATVEPTETPEPSPTPDLTGGGSGKIIFLSRRDGEDKFYSMKFDGSEQNVWLENPIPDIVSRFVPHYSPDGSKIAYTSEIEGNRNIYVANADGTGILQLTTYTDPISGSNPIWSPNGQQIVYWTNADNGIHIINADGSNDISLIEDSTGLKTFPAWSPDGSQIVFSWAYYDPNANPSLTDSEIVVVDVDDSQITAITDNEFQDINPVWSPDGTKIAFQSDRDDNFEIYVMNADGSKQTRLTDNEGNDFSPVWSPNGEFIAFTHHIQNEDGTNEANIWVINADGTNVRNLTEGQNGFNPYWLP